MIKKSSSNQKGVVLYMDRFWGEETHNRCNDAGCNTQEGGHPHAGMPVRNFKRLRTICIAMMKCKGRGKHQDIHQHIEGGGEG